MIIKRKKKKPQGDVIEKEELLQETEVEEALEEQPEEVESKEEDIDIFDLDNIDFKQRKERRRGDRRRGFRRIDDRNLISRAKEEANAIKEAAAKEGYQAGLEAAQADIFEIRNNIGEFMGAPQSVYEEIAPDILSISFEIAKKIIKKELSENSDVMIENIKELMSGLSKDEKKITVRVNPVQTDVLKRELPEAAQNIGIDAKISVIPDNAVSEGGCVLTTANGIIDATIESQLTIISEVLKEL